MVRKDNLVTFVTNLLKPENDEARQVFIHFFNAANTVCYIFGRGPNSSESETTDEDKAADPQNKYGDDINSLMAALINVRLGLFGDNLEPLEADEVKAARFCIDYLGRAEPARIHEAFATVEVFFSTERVADGKKYVNPRITRSPHGTVQIPLRRKPRKWADVHIPEGYGGNAAVAAAFALEWLTLNELNDTCNGRRIPEDNRQAHLALTPDDAVADRLIQQDMKIDQLTKQIEQLTIALTAQAEQKAPVPTT